MTVPATTVNKVCLSAIKARPSEIRDRMVAERRVHLVHVYPQARMDPQGWAPGIHCTTKEANLPHGHHCTKRTVAGGAMS